MWSDWRPSGRSRRGIEAVIQAFKVRNNKTDVLGFGVGANSWELYLQTKYWNILVLVDIHGLSKAWRGYVESLEDDWSVVCVFHGCWEFWRAEFRLSVWLVVNLGSVLLMQCSLDVDVSECDLTGDLQVDQDVVLKLSYRPSRSGITKQMY